MISLNRGKINTIILELKSVYQISFRVGGGVGGMKSDFSVSLCPFFSNIKDQRSKWTKSLTIIFDLFTSIVEYATQQFQATNEVLIWFLRNLHASNKGQLIAIF